jgi:glycosyltransferase involved in cell wall biosynthesis
LSVVLPVRDEAESIPVLARDLDSALKLLGEDWEVVWVDDGSTDETPQILDRLTRESPRHRWIRIETGCGQSGALAVGIEASDGEWIATLDGDGQNPPLEIPKLIEVQQKWGADMVNGWREGRADRWVRRVSSRIANGFRNRITGESVRDVGCALRLIRREALDGVPVFDGMHRFLPTLVRLNGYENIVEVPVSHRPRRHGQTHYGIHNRLWVGLVDTLAIRWLRKRRVAPRVLEKGSESAPAGDRGAAPAHVEVAS